MKDRATWPTLANMALESAVPELEVEENEDELLDLIMAMGLMVPRPRAMMSPLSVL